MQTPDRRRQLSSYLLIIGTILMIVGTILIGLGAILSGGDVSAGGVLLIGPIPIIFGGGRLGQVLALLATALTIVLLALTFRHKNCEVGQKNSQEEPHDAA